MSKAKLDEQLARARKGDELTGGISNKKIKAITDADGVASISNDHYEVAGLTDPGKRRTNNQDNFRLGDVELAGIEHTLALVCDGMGGHAGGEVASQIASDLIWNVVSKQSGGDDQALHQTMSEALERADAAIEQRASKEKELEGQWRQLMKEWPWRKGSSSL